MKTNKQENRLESLKSLLKVWRDALSKGQRRYLVASVGVHVLVVVLMSWSWASSESVKTFHIPSSVQARVLTEAEIDSLPYKQKQKQLLKDQIAAAKKKKELERKRKKDADKKRKQKAEKKRLLAEQKKLAAANAKKKLEQQRKKAESKRLEQQAESMAAQEKKRDQAKINQRKQELDRLEALSQKRTQALRDQRMAERLAAVKDLKAASNDAPVAYDLDEKTRFLSIIKSRIESRWFVPPNAGKSFVVLRIQLLPSGELSSVKVIDSSGNSALDQSALAAVKAVNKFEVPKESRFFEEYFRSFQMSFKPPQ